MSVKWNKYSVYWLCEQQDFGLLVWFLQCWLVLWIDVKTIQGCKIAKNGFGKCVLNWRTYIQWC